MTDGFRLELVIAEDAWLTAVPDLETRLEALLAHAAAAEQVQGAVVLLLADDAAVQDLNARFRGKDKPTNVLSFPAAPDAPSLTTAPHLGDIAMAYGVVVAESREQGKTVADHAAHLALHGFLHLLGYDHETEEEAALMEAVETKRLAELGYPDPY